MAFNNPPKAFLLLVGMVCVTILMAIGEPATPAEETEIDTTAEEPVIEDAI